MTMRVWLLAIGAVFVGIAAGLASTWLEFARIGSQFEPHNQAAGTSSSSGTRGRGPKAVVIGEMDFDFGVAQRNGALNHTFQIRNDGDEPLKLEKGATSCRCALSELKTGELPPGQTAEVRLDWKLTTLGEQYRQTAEIHTNDPHRPTLVLAVHGKVLDLVQLDPPELALTGVTSNEGATETVHLYGFKVNDVQILSQEFSNPETASFFSLTWRPATAEEMQVKKEATCGLTGTLTVKPGLPLGPINQTIELKSNVKDANKLELAITGSVISDISIVGPSNFSEKRGVLSFGVVEQNRGAKATLRILIKGPHREEAKPKLREVDPQDVLSVRLEEEQRINQGAVFMYPLQVEIPAGSRLVNRMGTDQAKMGKIIIETAHPTAKTIPIEVKFAVE